MSGAVKAIKKVFKSVGNAIKKVVKSKAFKVIVGAVAVYFTAGLAAGAMGWAGAAAMPGITAAAETLGISAGAFATAPTTLAAAATTSATTAATAAGITEAAVPMAEMAGATAGTAADVAGAAAGGSAAGGAVADGAMAMGEMGGATGSFGAAAPTTAAPGAFGTAEGAMTNLGAQVPMGEMGAATGANASSPSFLAKAWDGYKALPWQTQMTIGQAGLQGVSAMMNARAQNAAQQKQDEMYNRTHQYTPATLTQVPNGFYAKAKGA